MNLRSDGPGGSQSPEYLAISPHGFVPAIIDPNDNSRFDFHPEGLVIHDSAAVLSYLALTYADSEWYPIHDPVRLSQINYWLCYAANDINYSLLKVYIRLSFEKLS